MGIDISRAVLILLVFNVITTIVIFVSLSRGRNDENMQRLNGQVECISSNQIGETSPDIPAVDMKIPILNDILKEHTLNLATSFSSTPQVYTSVTRPDAKMEHDLAENEVKSFLSQPVINNHNFSYIHNPEDTCSRNKMKVLLVLPSAPNNFQKREVARSGSRGDYVKDIKNKAKMLFFLGRPGKVKDSITIQQKIDKESNTFGDIVQEDFEDVYKNNRLKSVSMLRWVSTFCQNTKYVIRTDDDITVNTSLLISTLDQTKKYLANFILGRRRTGDVPKRKLTNKYYMSVKEYAPSTLPPYLLGGLLGYPISTGRLLYEAALRVKPIWLEDVYISAMCASKVHVPILTARGFQFKHQKPNTSSV